MLTPEERERYARHILLKEVGGPGQQRLKKAAVAIVGMGGLGAPAALYLAAAGVGRLRLIDDDTVALSNLQRQVLYTSEDIGALKVERAAEALKALNANVEIEALAVRFSSSPGGEAAEGGASLNLREDQALDDAVQHRKQTASPHPSIPSPHGEGKTLLAGADIVLDGTDDFATRFAVNAACHELGITLVSGAVGRWEGQVATFKSGLTKHLPAAQRLPCYRCLVPDIPPNAETCAQVGIVGALTGVIGSMMALEAIKEIAEAGDSVAGRLLFYDALKAESRITCLPRDPHCTVCSGR